MHKENGVRFDRIERPQGGIEAVWGFRSGGEDSIVREYLALAYPIPMNGHRVRSDMTHEFTLYMLHPKVQIDLNRNLFEQPELVPIKPAVHGFQLSVFNDDWVELHCHSVVELVRNFEDEIDTTLIDKIVLKHATTMVSLNREHQLLAAV